MRSPLPPFLRPLVRRHGPGFLAAVGFLLVEAFCDLAQPTLLSRIIDDGVVRRDLGAVLAIGGLMLAVAAVGASAALARNFLSSRVSQHFGSEVREGLYRRVQGFSAAALARFETASLVTRLTNDVTQLQNFVNGLMRMFVKAPLLLFGSLVMASALNGPLTLVFAAVVPVVVALIAVSLRTSFPWFRKVQALTDRLNGVVREFLSGVRVVKAFHRADYETRRFEAANLELGGATASAARVLAVFSPATAWVLGAGIAAVLWFGGAQVDAGSMQVGQVVAFVNYMTQVLFSLMLINFVFNAFVRARASVERLGEVMETAVAEQASGAPVSTTGRVSFEKVAFRYEGGGAPVLSNVTFEAEPGQWIGVVGSLGSGKSTLVHLIPRFYDATDGAVRLDGVDVRHLDPRELRRAIALVPQRSVLFTGTIRENLKWGDANATDQQLAAAAETAQARAFIEAFPQGYDTRLGQGGVNLSGGQKQRLALARALLKRPRVLLLDDAASAVDPATEAALRAALRRNTSATTFVVAQRIASVRACDHILVLDEGRQVGWGRHDVLMETCRTYQEIVQSQSGLETLP